MAELSGDLSRSVSSAVGQDLMVSLPSSSESVSASKAKQLKPTKEVVAILERCQKSLTEARASETVFFSSGNVQQLTGAIAQLRGEIDQRQLELGQMRQAQTADPSLRRNAKFTAALHTAELRIEELVSKKAALDKLAANSDLQKVLSVKREINGLLDRARADPAGAGELIYQAQRAFGPLGQIKEKNPALASEIETIETRLFSQASRLAVSEQHHKGIDRFVELDALPKNPDMGPLDKYHLNKYRAGIADPKTKRFQRANSALTTMLARGLALGDSSQKTRVQSLRTAIHNEQLTQNQKQMLADYDNMCQASGSKGPPPPPALKRHGSLSETVSVPIMSESGVQGASVSRSQISQGKVKLTFTDRIRITGVVRGRCDQIAGRLNEVSVKALKIDKSLDTAGREAVTQKKDGAPASKGPDFALLQGDISSLRKFLEVQEREIAIVAADPRLKNSEAAQKLDAQTAKLRAQLNTLEAQSAALEKTFSAQAREAIQLRGQIGELTQPLSPSLFDQSVEKMQRFSQALSVRDRIEKNQSSLTEGTPDRAVVDHELVQANLLITAAYSREMQEVNKARSEDGAIRAEMAKSIPQRPDQGKLVGYARRLMLQIGTPKSLQSEGEGFRTEQERSSAIQDVERLRAQLGEDGWKTLVQHASINPLLERYEKAQAETPALRNLEKARQAMVEVGRARLVIASVTDQLTVAQSALSEIDQVKNPKKAAALQKTIDTHTATLAGKSAEILDGLVVAGKNIQALKELSTPPWAEIVVLEGSFQGSVGSVLDLSTVNAGKLKEWTSYNAKDPKSGKVSWSEEAVTLSPSDYGAFKEIYANQMAVSIYSVKPDDALRTLDQLDKIMSKYPDLARQVQEDRQFQTLKSVQEASKAALTQRTKGRSWIQDKAYQEFSSLQLSRMGSLGQQYVLFSDPEFQKLFSAEGRVAIQSYAQNLGAVLQYEQGFRRGLAELESTAADQEQFTLGLGKLYSEGSAAQSYQAVLKMLINQNREISGLLEPVSSGNRSSEINKFRDKLLEKDAFAVKQLWGGKAIGNTELSPTTAVQAATRVEMLFNTLAERVPSLRKVQQSYKTIALQSNELVRTQERQEAIERNIPKIMTALMPKLPRFSLGKKKQELALADQQLVTDLLEFATRPSTQNLSAPTKLIARLQSDPVGRGAVSDLNLTVLGPRGAATQKFVATLSDTERSQLSQRLDTMLANPRSTFEDAVFADTLTKSDGALASNPAARKEAEGLVQALLIPESYADRRKAMLDVCRHLSPEQRAAINNPTLELMWSTDGVQDMNITALLPQFREALKDQQNGEKLLNAMTLYFKVKEKK